MFVLELPAEVSSLPRNTNFRVYLTAHGFTLMSGCRTFSRDLHGSFLSLTAPTVLTVYRYDNKVGLLLRSSFSVASSSSLAGHAFLVSCSNSVLLW